MPATNEQQTIDIGVSMETEEGLAIIDALNEVSDVSAMAGSKVTFAGTPAAQLPPMGRLQGVDVFSCPRGWFLLFKEPQGAYWCTAGADLDAALNQVHEQDLRGQVRHQIERAGLTQRD